MRIASILYPLVLLILSQVASARSPESTLLLGTIQFPQNIQTMPDVPVIFRASPIATQVDKTNHTITFSIFREPTQFNFGFLIAEPQSIEPVYLTSKYQVEPTNLVAYQRIKSGHAYRYFTLTLIPEIQKSGADRKVTYSWRWRESTLPAKRKIPDDALIVHTAPEWIESLYAGTGFNFPTIRMCENMGTEQMRRKRLEKIALAGLDTKPFQGTAQAPNTKLVGTTLVIAPAQRVS